MTIVASIAAVVVCGGGLWGLYLYLTTPTPIELQKRAQAEERKRREQLPPT